MGEKGEFDFFVFGFVRTRHRRSPIKPPPHLSPKNNKKIPFSTAKKGTSTIDKRIKIWYNNKNTLWDIFAPPA